MPKPVTIPVLRQRHAAEERAAVVAALEAHDWRLIATAEALGLPIGSLRRLIATHGLSDEYAAKAHSRGRPRTKA